MRRGFSSQFSDKQIQKSANYRWGLQQTRAHNMRMHAAAGRAGLGLTANCPAFEGDRVMSLALRHFAYRRATSACARRCTQLARRLQGVRRSMKKVKTKRGLRKSESRAAFS